MNHEYFFAQDLAGNRQKVQVLGPSHPSDDSAATHTVYALEDGSAVERVDNDTFRIIGTDALVTVVRE